MRSIQLVVVDDSALTGSQLVMETSMSRESLENAKISDGKQSVNSILQPELADYGKVMSQQRPVDKSLKVGADNSLSFDTASLYGESASKKDRNHEKQTHDLVTNTALDVLIRSNTNGNDKVDRDEWMKVSSQLGFGKEEADRVYDIGVKLDAAGLSLKEITERLITPRLVTAQNGDGFGPAVTPANSGDGFGPVVTGDNSGFGPAVTPANSGDGFGPVVTGDNSGFGPAVTPANSGDGFGPAVTANSNNGFGPAVG